MNHTYGIRAVYSSQNLSIENNTLTLNNGAIEVAGDNNTIANNTVVNNSNYGIYVRANNNLIYNNLFNNSNNYKIDSRYTNFWNTSLTSGKNIIGGNYIGGNAWLTPSGNGFSQTCIDTDGDTICDVPYDLLGDGTNVDYLPLVYDKEPPEVSVISPMDKVYGTNTVQINVSVTDRIPISKVIAQIDGTTNVTLTYQNGYYVGTTPALSDGNHYIKIYANDTFGNMNSSVVVYFVIDTTPPMLKKKIGEPKYNKLVRGNVTLINESFENGFPSNWSYFTSDPPVIQYDLSRGGDVAYLSNAGSGKPCHVTTSSFSLVGYTSAELKYWSRLWVGSAGNEVGEEWLQISTDGGVTWTTLKKYTFSHWWQETTIDLTPYIGNSDVKLRWYLVVWTGVPSSYLWIDDIVVTGSLAPTNKTYISPRTPIYINASDISSVHVNVSVYSFETGNTSYYQWDNWGTNGVINETIYLTKEGKHWINVTAWDGLNNVVHDNETVYVDGTPPAITFTAPTPANNSIVNQSVTIAVNVTDAISNVSTALININGTNYTMSKIGSGKAVNFSYTITSEGTYAYRIYANDSLNHWNSTEKRIVTIDKTLPKIIVINPSPVYRNKTANLTVTIIDSNPNRYEVYRNGTFVESGGYQNDTSFNISINTTALGFWNYTIKANDTAGNENLTRVIVEVVNNPPVATFTASKTSARTGESITFDASASSDLDGFISSYQWDFGDGSTAFGITVTHSYTSAGTYTIKLTVTDNDGAKDNTTLQITVTAPPVRGGAGGGGGGGATFISPPLEAPSDVKQTGVRTFSAGEENVLKPSAEVRDASDVIEVRMKPKETVTLAYTISKVKELPEKIPSPPFDTYRMFEVSFVKYGTDFIVHSEGKIKFRVSKEWMRNNNHEKDRIILMKYKGEWIEIPTQIVDEDENYVYYESNVKSFSLFAIVVKPPVEKPVKTETTALPETTTITTPTPVKTTPTPGFEIAFTILTILIALRLRKYL